MRPGGFNLSALQLDMDDFPAALADLRGSHWRHCASCGEHRYCTRLAALNFRGGVNERSLLDFGPGDVVDNKGRDHGAITRSINRLPCDGDEGNDAAQLRT